MTIALVLVLVACVGVGVWDLFSNAHRAPLKAALACEAGLLLGSVLQLFVPGGFVVGAATGLLAGVPAFRTWARGRVALVRSMAASQDADALALLRLHDRLDGLGSYLERAHRLTGALALVLLAVAGVSLAAVGLADDVWTLLAAGSLALFLPLAHSMRVLSEGTERRALEEAIEDSTPRVADRAADD